MKNMDEGHFSIVAKNLLLIDKERSCAAKSNDMVRLVRTLPSVDMSLSLNDTIHDSGNVIPDT